MTRVLEENMVSARKGFETLGKLQCPAARICAGNNVGPYLRDRCWWCAPEILRLEAKRIRIEDGLQAKKASESLLRLSLEIATEQGGLLWRLRILTSLVELRCGGVGLQEAATLLNQAVNELTA